MCKKTLFIIQLLQGEKREQISITEFDMKLLLEQNFVCPLNETWKHASWNSSIFHNPNTRQIFKSAKEDMLTSICGRLADYNGCKLEKAVKV